MHGLFRKDVKFLHVEILAEEIGHSIPAEVSLVGHAKAIIRQLTDGIREPAPPAAATSTWKLDDSTECREWVASLRTQAAENVSTGQALALQRGAPLNYYCPLAIINSRLPRNAIIVNEGSETMDIGRTSPLASLLYFRDSCPTMMMRDWNLISPIL